MTNCDPRIEAYMEAVETGKVEASKDVKALMKHVRKCFETEDIYVDQQQLTDYLGLARYFPYDEVFPWQQFVIGLHDCTYWRENGRPRWPDLFCLIGRGAGKDGTIALESTALASEYNGIREYDVDICANNEDQALRPVKDIVGAFEQPKWLKKLQRFFKWTREEVVCKDTRSTIKGHTNNPGGKDGLRSGMVVLNEIHQYQDYKNINVFTTGLGKKKHPRRSYYTTQGDVREGPLDDLLETAEEILFGGEPDNGLLPFICRLDSKEEVHDEKNWEKANPSLRYLPDLMEEIRKEYRDWLKRPEKFTAFMTKRMNLPDGSSEIKVCAYERIKATNRPVPVDDLVGRMCTCGIDFSKVTDMISVNLHFRDVDTRYDLNHSWLCLQSKDLPRIKAPWKEWADRGHITLVDDVEIHPELIVDYIAAQMECYSIKKMAIDDFRYALVLYEALANGLEHGIVQGTGKDEPIGMMKQVGEGVVVTGGKYPDKNAIKMTALDMTQMGNVTAIMARNDKGQARTVTSLILLVNPVDYFRRVLPATRMLTPDGIYASVLPVDAEIIQSAAVPEGKAVYGMATKYFLGVGMAKNGKIEYSDEYRFLEDERVYLIKLYAHGFALDNNAFQVLDIKDLQPLRFKIVSETEKTKTDDATLADLKIGALKLSPTFTAGTTEYTATTQNASNTITAVPASSTAEIEITVGDVKVTNGAAANWSEGSNTVTVKVTDGAQTKSYKVTVTKE